MAQSFFWYDLETTGVRTHDCRIMQFAGQRTDMDLQPIGESVNILIKLTPDVLPDPEAVLLTGITPQMTLADGITEVEFLKFFEAEIATPDTIFVGYNTVRFDDEFIRCLRYRNFYDPYDWAWKDGRSRWDLLDVVRMTRALRPDGIEWPFTEDGTPTNRLELLTKLNGLDHEHAHDALNDVLASIAVAKLIRDKEPKLFQYLLELRTKQAVKKFLQDNKTFVYSSGKYANEHQKTTVVQVLRLGDDATGALVYDLTHDPAEFIDMDVEQLVERWHSRDPAVTRLPVKTLKYNRCPAICPTGLMADEATQTRLGISLKVVEDNRRKLAAAPQLLEKILQARVRLDEDQAERQDQTAEVEAELQLYGGGFLDDHDTNLLRAIHSAEPAELTAFQDSFHDARFRAMLPRYKARNFPDSLSAEERQAWDDYLRQSLFAGGKQSKLAQYFDTLARCAADEKYASKQFLLEELQLYGQSIMPAELES